MTAPSASASQEISTEQVNLVLDAALDEKEYVDYLRHRREESTQAPDIAASRELTKTSCPIGLQVKGGTETTNLDRISYPHVPPPWIERSKPKTEYFVALESWEGTVEEVTPEGIVARLVPDKEDGEELSVTIKREEIDDDDAQYVVPGAVFYWRIGYSQGRSGRRRSSVIRFRRLPRWTASDLRHAEEEANRLYELFGSP